ncbi:MAG: hypothetical protein IJN49_02755, partial [Clostridia bacterium]|nr:hypothetical protein [Clostridia bacterium]
IIKTMQTLCSENSESPYAISFEKFIKTENDITDFANHLISLSGEIPPEEEKILLCFFQTSLNYLKDFYNKKNHNLYTLALLASLLVENTSYNESIYDQLIKESLQKSYLSKHTSTRDFYKQFLQIRSKDTPAIINKHLFNITENYQEPEN